MRKQIVEEREIDFGGEAIADAITKISHSMENLNATRLTRKAIVALIHERSKVARNTIEVVLNNLDDLEDTWLKKK